MKETTYLKRYEKWKETVDYGTQLYVTRNYSLFGAKWIQCMLEERPLTIKSLGRNGNVGMSNGFTYSFLSFSKRPTRGKFFYVQNQDNESIRCIWYPKSDRIVTPNGEFERLILIDSLKKRLPVNSQRPFVIRKGKIKVGCQTLNLESTIQILEKLGE